MAKPQINYELNKGITIRVNTGCGNLYCTINDKQLFITTGKPGGCSFSMLESLARVITIALRNGTSLKEIKNTLCGIRCPSPSMTGKEEVLSCADAVSKAIDIYMSECSGNTASNIK